MISVRTCACLVLALLAGCTTLQLGPQRYPSNLQTPTGQNIAKIISNGSFQQALSSVDESLANLKSLPANHSNPYRVLGATSETLPDGSLAETSDDGSTLTYKVTRNGKVVEQSSSTFEIVMTDDTSLTYLCTEKVLVSQTRQLGTYRKTVVQQLALGGELPASTASIEFSPDDPHLNKTEQVVKTGIDLAHELLVRELKGALADGSQINASFTTTAVLTEPKSRIETNYDATVQNASQSVKVDLDTVADNGNVNGNFNLDIAGKGLLALGMNGQVGQLLLMGGSLQDSSNQTIGTVASGAEKIVYPDGAEEPLDLNSAWILLQEARGY